MGGLEGTSWRWWVGVGEGRDKAWRAFLGPGGDLFRCGIHCPLHTVKKQNNTSYIFTRPEVLTPKVSLTSMQGEGPTDRERGESLPQPLPAHPTPRKELTERFA